MNKSIFAFLLGVILGGAIVLVVLNASCIPSDMEAVNANGMIVTYPKSDKQDEQQIKKDYLGTLGDVTISWPDEIIHVKNGDEVTFTVTVTGERELSRHDVECKFLDCNSMKKISNSTYEVTGIIKNIQRPTTFEYFIGNSNGIVLQGSAY